MNYKLIFADAGPHPPGRGAVPHHPHAGRPVLPGGSLPFLYTILPVGILGTLLARARSNAEFFSQEGFTVVGLIWLSFCLFGALPFF